MDEDLSIRNDPDYKEFHQTNKNDPNAVRAEDSKHLVMFKIKDILQKQFSMEMEFKEEEIQKIEQRINQTKSMLDRLRAYVAAGYYGSGGLIIPGSKSVDKEPKKKKAKKGSSEADIDPVATSLLLKTSSTIPANKDTADTDVPVADTNSITQPLDSQNESRFYVCKKLIVGNVSKYLLADARKENDQSTHKWMVYVRTESGDDKEIDKYIKSVSFFLHPSYIPNDIVTVTKPPFQVTRRGWGEFPVRVQLHFRDARNKRFDVIHNLKLDKTYTGLQTLGAETIVDIELHKHASNENRIVPGNSETQLADRNVPKQMTDQKQIDDSPEPNENKITKEDGEVLKLTLPVIADLRSKLPATECASVASSCVSSANPSRSNSPDAETLFNSTSLLDSDIDNILYQLLPNAPLIATEGFRSKFFTCPSLDMYKHWHFTKRRAYEWHRAAYLRRSYLKNSKEPTGRCPTTKEIMIWLRHCGFTPPEKDLHVVEKEIICCGFCGKCLDHDQNSNLYCSKCLEQTNALEPLTNTLSPFTSVLSNVKLKEETLQCIEKARIDREESDTDIDLDITSVKSKDIESGIQTELNVIYPVLSEIWVTNVLQHIGISLKPYVMSNTRTPVVQAMLFAAMKAFMCHLLRKSNIEAKLENKNTLEPVLVTFRQVQSTILKEPLFDFLTDAHLGKL